MSDREETRQQVRGTWITELSAALGALIGLFSILAQFLDLPLSFVVAILTPLIFALAFIAYSIRRLYAVTTVSVNVALGGPPGVGKTVFVNALCSALMEEYSSRLSFTPDVQTAQKVYRTVGDLRHGEWPKQTSTDQIARYRGRLALRQKSALRTLFNGRIEFRMEFGDSAGENWSDLSSEYARESPPRLIDSTFFQYVGDSDALYYFIDCLSLGSLEALNDQVDDLLSTLQLLRAIQGGRPGTPLVRPICVLLSKADLLSSSEFELVKDLVTRYPNGQGESASRRLAAAESQGTGHGDFPSSFLRLVRLFDIVSSQTANFSAFVISSAMTLEERNSVSHSLLNIATTRTVFNPQPVELPAEWVFTRLWQTRRLRPNQNLRTA